MFEINVNPADVFVRRAGAIGQRLVDLRVVQELVGQVSGWSGRTARIQEATLGALNLPSAVGQARLERRLRSVSDRIGRLEDQLDSVADQISRVNSAAGAS